MSTEEDLGAIRKAVAILTTAQLTLARELAGKNGTETAECADLARRLHTIQQGKQALADLSAARQHDNWDLMMAE